MPVGAELRPHERRLVGLVHDDELRARSGSAGRRGSARPRTPPASPSRPPARAAGTGRRRARRASPASSAIGMARSSASPSWIVVGSLGRNRVVITDCFNPSAAICGKNTAPGVGGVLARVVVRADVGSRGCRPRSRAQPRTRPLPQLSAPDSPVRRKRSAPRSAGIVALSRVQRLDASRTASSRRAGAEPHRVVGDEPRLGLRRARSPRGPRRRRGAGCSARCRRRRAAAGERDPLVQVDELRQREQRVARVPLDLRRARPGGRARTRAARSRG